jgi:hypothetical protein
MQVTKEFLNKVRHLSKDVGCSPSQIANILKVSQTRIKSIVTAIHASDQMEVRPRQKRISALERRSREIQIELMLAKDAEVRRRAALEVGAKLQPNGKLKLREPA